MESHGSQPSDRGRHLKKKKKNCVPPSSYQDPPMIWSPRVQYSHFRGNNYIIAGGGTYDYDDGEHYDDIDKMNIIIELNEINFID